MVRKIGEFEKSGVKLQCSTEEGKRPLARVIGRFEKLRVREIGIPLYIERVCYGSVHINVTLKGLTHPISLVRRYPFIIRQHQQHIFFGPALSVYNTSTSTAYLNIN